MSEASRNESESENGGKMSGQERPIEKKGPDGDFRSKEHAEQSEDGMRSKDCRPFPRKCRWVSRRS